MSLRACICSVISRSYIPFAQVLVDSIREHHDDLDVLICVIDGYVEEAPQGSIGISSSELLGPAALEDMLYRYTRQALVVSSKSPILQVALRRGYDRAVFLDVDILVMDRLDALVDPAAPAILLTPHLLAPLTDGATSNRDEAAVRELNILLHGVNNGGCISVSNDGRAWAFLNWFTDRLRTACLLDREQGLHYDQTCLDLAMTMFDGVEQMRDPTGNVAYWNLRERPMQRRGHRWFLDDDPVRFFHFSGFDPRNPGQMTRYRPDLSRSAFGEAGDLFDEYGSRVLAAGAAESIMMPSGLHHFADGAAVPDRMRELATIGQIDVTGLNPNVATSADVRRQLGSTSMRISELWRSYWAERPDLQEAYPNVDGHDRAGFDAWIQNSGPHEAPELYALLEAPL